MGVLFVLLFHLTPVLRERFVFIGFVLSAAGWMMSAFFSISAFLLFERLQRGQQTYESWRTAFWLRRFFRIMPLWWATVCLHYLLFGMPEKVLLANLSFFFGFIYFHLEYLPIVVAWSLFVEELFYVVLPWIFPILNKRTTYILFGLVLMWIASISWRYYSRGLPLPQIYIHRFPLNYFQMFLLGILIRVAFQRTDIARWIIRSEQLLIPKTAWLDFLSLLFSVLSSYFYRINSWVSFCILEELTVVFWLVALLTPGTLISRVCQNRFLQWVGVRCYAIYILQDTVSQIIRGSNHLITIPFFALGTIQLELLALGLNLLALFAIAKVSWDYFERPFQDLSKLLLKKFDPPGQLPLPNV